MMIITLVSYEVSVFQTLCDVPERVSLSKMSCQMAFLLELDIYRKVNACGSS